MNGLIKTLKNWVIMKHHHNSKKANRSESFWRSKFFNDGWFRISQWFLKFFLGLGRRGWRPVRASPFQKFYNSTSPPPTWNALHDASARAGSPQPWAKENLPEEQGRSFSDVSRWINKFEIPCNRHPVKIFVHSYSCWYSAIKGTNLLFMKIMVDYSL